MPRPTAGRGAPADLSTGRRPRLAERAGAVDVLVANAALPSSGALNDFTPEQLDRALDVNLRAPIQLSRELVPGWSSGAGSPGVHLLAVGQGRLHPLHGLLGHQFGLRGFASGLREDLHGTGWG